jgi:hypothetical protein
MIKSYYQFIIESVLFTSNQFKDILKSIDDVIAKDFLELIDHDVKTTYNALNVTDKNDTISFIPDNQFQNKIKSSNLENLLKDDKNKTSVGRLIQKILKDNGKDYNPNQVTAFTDKFKAAWTKYNTKEEKEPIRVVEKEDIRSWYLEDAYNTKTNNGVGTLGKSCMRYVQCQEYLDIYVENPDVCKMIIMTEEELGDEVLVSRALLWKTEEEGWYLDRIYYTDASERILIHDFAKKNFNIKYSYDFPPTVPRLTIKLSGNKDYEYYPYMDSFPYYYSLDGILYNWEARVAEKKYLYNIQNTDGSADPQNMVYCSLDDNYYSDDEVIYSAYHDCDIPIDNSVYSYYHNSEIYEPNSVYSKTLGDYLSKDDAIEVIIDSNDIFDYFPHGHKDIVDEYETGEWYLKELLVKVGRDYYLEQYVRKIYQVSEKSKVDYIRIFNLDSDTSLEACVCSPAIKEFWNLKVEGEGEILPYNRYLQDVYKLVIVDVLKKSIESKKSESDKEIYQEVQFELDDASYKLNISGSPFQHLNWANSIGGESGFYNLFIKTITENKYKGEGIIEASLDSAVSDRYELVLPRILELLPVVEEIITEHLPEFCEATENMRSDNIKFHSSKMPNIVKLIETKLPQAKLESVFRIIKSTIFKSIRLAYNSNLFGRPGYFASYEVESFMYFMSNPNKFDKLKYNP